MHLTRAPARETQGCYREMTARGVHRSTLPEEEAQMKLSWGVRVRLAGEGTAEARRDGKSQGGAQVKFEERRSCFGWGLSPGRGRRGRSSQGTHLTGLGGSGASRVPAQHPPPSPVPAPAAHGACLGQMPAGSNRERPKLFGSSSLRIPLPLHLSSPPRGGARRRLGRPRSLRRAVAWARQEKLLTGGR